jgi:AcrR family transcriptional regulator
MAIKTEVLLDAAAAQLARRPNSTLAQIADAAGVSRTTLFYLPHDLEHLRTALLEIVWENADLPSNLRRVTAALMPMAERMQVVLREAPSHASPDMNDSWAYAIEPLSSYLRAQQSAGALKKKLPITWLVESLIYLMFAAWDSVSTDVLDPKVAAELVGQTWLDGASS